MSKQLAPLFLAGLLLVILAGCAPAPDAPEQPSAILPESGEEEVIPAAEAEIPAAESAEGGMPMVMSLTSPAFNNGDAIPANYSCDGEDLSPDLDWFGIPEGTQSLAVIMDDPDAPSGSWVHWVLFNIPADMPGLRAGISGAGVDGNNSWGRTGYRGPCPPGGTHRYFFRLYALDTLLDLAPGTDKQALLTALEGHVLGQAELMGTYSR